MFRIKRGIKMKKKKWCKIYKK